MGQRLEQKSLFYFSREDIQKVKRHMKRYATSLIIRGTPIRMSSKRPQIKSVGKMWEKGNPVHCWWEKKPVQSLWKIAWKFLKKLKTELPYDPEIPFLNIYPKKMKTLTQKDTCT